MAGFYSPYGTMPYGMQTGCPPPSIQNYQSQGFQSQPMALIRVTGLEGARAYQMPPNSVAALFDGNDDIFYIKSTDSGGFGTVNAYRFERYEERKEAQTGNNYVTHDELNLILDELRETIRNGKQSIQRKPTTGKDE